MKKDKEKYIGEKLELHLGFGFATTVTVSAGGQELKDLSLTPTLYDNLHWKDITHLPLSTTVIEAKVRDANVPQRLKSWIQQCEEHPECTPKKTKCSPHRLIDVIPGLHLRTCDGSESDFAALSYCWGHYQGPMLTQTNLKAFHERLDENDLPQTYKDAIWVTRKLQIRYLWIDALCILQDNEEDWRAESMKMDQIYGSARLTIAASSASSVTDGFLGDRQSHPIWAYCGTITHVDEQYPVYMVDERELRSFQFHIHEPHGPLGKQPLASRGWAVQERLLSPRIVYFTSNRMIWQCRNGIATEEGLFCGSPSHITSTNRKTADSYWSEAVKQFSACKLSNPSDRLPALAGLGNILSDLRANDDALLFGHWKNDIVCSLLWVVLPDEGPKTQDIVREPLCKAPTWSWASMAPGVQVLPSYTSPDSYMADGPIARVLELPSPSMSADAGHNDRMLGLWIRTPLVDGTVEPHPSPRLAWAATLNFHASAPCSLVIEARFDEFQQDPVRVRQCSLALLWDSGLFSYEGLLLEPVPTNTVQFRRVGTFKTMADFDYKKSLVRQLATEREICLQCQREAGSAFAINALIEAHQLTTNTLPEHILMPSESGFGQVIARCPRCRVAVWSYYGDHGPHLKFLRVATLDRREQAIEDLLRPEAFIFTKYKMPWTELPEYARAEGRIFEEYYDERKIYSDEAFLRYRAVDRKGEIWRLEGRQWVNFGEAEDLRR
ncbi:hypothetical protein PRZ48_010974 [Zasmidium cellare]|uniref:Heterokaryon incompatibility domain-containing protein n=1 Tax=Zasmidium cellare TaxID=395010 RepID=A0ABR0EA65_ZASCE|nr:hypothetical protein PRZ48_010974 [Zasmidium cellare]